MEGLAPPLQLLCEVKRAIENGATSKQGTLNFVRKYQGEFPIQIARWLNLMEQGQKTDNFLTVIPSIHRRALLQLLERGFRGESIYQPLLTMEEEIISACQDEQNRVLARLPFLLLVPLLFFMFPAYLVLLFGPLLGQFLQQLGGQP